MATLREIRERRAKQQGKPSLAELRARKQEEKTQTNGLAALRERKRMQKQSQPAKKSKADFNLSGVRFHNVQQYDGYWTIDVSNGDKTYTLHNRCGAWFHDINGRDGYMAEPVQVAKALGTGMTQIEISQALMSRLDAELKLRGIPTREQALRQREEEAKISRRKNRKHDDDTEE